MYSAIYLADTYEQSEKWPEDVKPFAFRYLHENDLYNARKSNLSAVVVFGRSLEKHLKIKCTDVEDAMMQRKCERLISRMARKWSFTEGYGFLEESNGHLRKTAQFEAAWTESRREWIDSVHASNPTGVIELDASPSGVAERAESSTGEKRASPSIVQAMTPQMLTHRAGPLSVGLSFDVILFRYLDYQKTKSCCPEWTNYQSTIVYRSRARVANQS